MKDIAIHPPKNSSPKYRSENKPSKSFKDVMEKTKKRHQDPQHDDSIISPFDLPKNLSGQMPLRAECLESEAIGSSGLAKTASIESPAALDAFCRYVENHAIRLIRKADETKIEAIYLKENSPFNNLEIHIDHYDIAPHSFHIEFYGSPEAVARLHPHVEDLHLHLETTLPDCIFHIASPYLKDDKPKTPFQKTKQKSKDPVPSSHVRSLERH